MDADQQTDHRAIADQIPTGHWVVDRSGSQVNVSARTFCGLLPVNGFFDRFAGVLDVDPDGQSSGALVVETASLRTGIDRRDARLLAPGMLDAQSHPEIVFTSQKIGPSTTPEMRISDEDRLQIVGELELAAARIPLDFPMTAIVHGDHLHVEGRVRLSLADVGLRRTRGLIGRRVRVDVALTLRSTSSPNLA